MGQRVNLNLTAVLDQNTMESLRSALKTFPKLNVIRHFIYLTTPFTTFIKSPMVKLAELQRSCHYRTQSGQHLLSQEHMISYLVFKIIISQLYNRTTILLLLLLILLLIIINIRVTPNNNNNL